MSAQELQTQEHTDLSLDVARKNRLIKDNSDVSEFMGDKAITKYGMRIGVDACFQKGTGYSKPSYNVLDENGEVMKRCFDKVSNAKDFIKARNHDKLKQEIAALKIQLEQAKEFLRDRPTYSFSGGATTLVGSATVCGPALTATTATQPVTATQPMATGPEARAHENQRPEPRVAPTTRVAW